MPVNVTGWYTKGMPTDEDILEWRNKLTLCVEEIEAGYHYNLEVGGEDYDQEELDTAIASYGRAIAALNDLLCREH